MDTYKPRIVCFACKFGWGYLFPDLFDQARTPEWIPVACSGKIEVRHILSAMKKGADGVLILICREGNCHFQDGNFKTEAKAVLTRSVLTAHGIDADRVRIVSDLDPDGATIQKLVADLRHDIQKLGPLELIHK